MKNPAVSILIPVYNAENYISECLNALQSQTFQDFEIICLNDGSTDNSLNILKDWSENFTKLKIINQENNGVAVARNRLIKEAKGKYIAFVDADDIVSEDYLFKLYKAAEKEKADIVKCFFEEISADGNTKTTAHCSHIFYKKPENNLKDRFICGYYDSVVWGKLFRSDMLRKNKLSFLPGHIAEDFPFVILSFLSASNIIIVKEALYYYRKGLSNAITSDNRKMAIDILHNLLNLYDKLNERKLFHQGVPDEWIKAVVWSICRFRKFPPKIRKESVSLQQYVWKKAEYSIKQCSLIYRIRWGILFYLVKIFGWNSVYKLSKIFR